MTKRRRVFCWFPRRVWRYVRERRMEPAGWVWLRHATVRYTLWNGWIAWEDDQ